MPGASLTCLRKWRGSKSFASAAGAEASLVIRPNWTPERRHCARGSRWTRWRIPVAWNRDAAWPWGSLFGDVASLSNKPKARSRERHVHLQVPGGCLQGQCASAGKQIRLGRVSRAARGQETRPGGMPGGVGRRHAHRDMPGERCQWRDASGEKGKASKTIRKKPTARRCLPWGMVSSGRGLSRQRITSLSPAWLNPTAAEPRET